MDWGTHMWRQMLAGDIVSVNSLGDEIHVNYPEDLEVFNERFRLYPAGCLACEMHLTLVGYAISHPWMKDAAPALNSFIKQIPPQSNAYYIHDVALRPSERGKGLGAQVVSMLKSHARASGYGCATLISVNHSVEFWQQCGFSIKYVSSLREKLSTYDSESVFMQCDL